MNPMSYLATQALDEALIGRFALFLYPPDVLQMNERDRIRVTTHINGDDAPGLGEWTSNGNGKTVSGQAVAEVGIRAKEMLRTAAGHFTRLKEELPTLSMFLARFADLVMRESKGEVALDGRRLGFIHRNILANRAIELSKADTFGTRTGPFAHSARYALESSIPLGLNDRALKREEAIHKVEICFDLLSSFFEKGSEVRKVDLIYELFTTADLMRKAEILLMEDLGELAKSKAWTDMINDDREVTLLAYTALQVEARRPGTVPKELLESLSRKISPAKFSTESIPRLKGESIEYIDEIEALLDRDADLSKLVAFHQVSRLAANERITPSDIEETRRQIDRDVAVFERLIEAHPMA
jgi:hypothetical protein